MERGEGRGGEGRGGKRRDLVLWNKAVHLGYIRERGEEDGKEMEVEGVLVTGDSMARRARADLSGRNTKTSASDGPSSLCLPPVVNHGYFKMLHPPLNSI